jgi:hypothetical protein
MTVDDFPIKAGIEVDNGVTKYSRWFENCVLNKVPMINKKHKKTLCFLIIEFQH